MLATACVAGLAAGGWGWPGLLATGAAGAALGAVQEQGRRRWALALAAVIAAAATLAVAHRIGLLLPGGAGLLLLFWRLRARRGSWGEQLAGIGLMAAAAAGVGYSAGGTAVAAGVTGGLVAFHLTGGLLRVRGATGRADISALWPEVVGLIASSVLALAGGLAPPFSLLSFIPGLVRSLRPQPRPRGREEFRRLGRMEALVSAGFLVLFVAAIVTGRPVSWR